MKILARVPVLCIVSIVLITSCATTPTQHDNGAPAASSSGQTRLKVTQVSKKTREETFDSSGFSTGSVLYIYDENGRLVQENQLDEKKALTRKRLYTNSADGKKVDVTIKNGNGELQASIQREYDAAGNLLHETLSNAKNEVQSSSEYTWNSEGKMLSWLSKGPADAVIARTIYTVQNGLTTLIEVQDPDGKLIKRFEQTFGKDGQIASKTEKDPQGAVVSQIVFSYADGKLAREDVQNGAGALLRSVVYEYNDRSLPVKLQFLDRKGQLLETRVQEFQIFSRTDTIPAQ